MKALPDNKLAQELLGFADHDFVVNWQNAPYNRTVYQDLGRLLPMTPVWRGRQGVSELDIDIQILPNPNFITVSNEKISIEQWLVDDFSDGFLVIKDGKLICENYYHGMRQQTRHHLMSVSKSYCGTLAGVFVESAQLELSAPLENYIAEIKGTQWQGITVEQVLNMVEPMQFLEVFDDPSAEIFLQERAMGWRPAIAGEEQGIHEFMLNMKRNPDADGQFTYKSTSTDMLAWVLESISGLGYAELLSQEIWSKLGAEEDGQCLVDRCGQAIANGGLGATLRDVARFGLMMLNNGRNYQGEQVVPENWVEKSRFADNNTFSHYDELFPGGGYSNQWWSIDAVNGVMCALGYAGQYIYINPNTQTLIVKLSTYDNMLSFDRFGNGRAALLALDEALA